MDGDLMQEVDPNEIPQILQAWKKNYPQNFIQCQGIENMEKSIRENVRNPEQKLYRCGDIENGVYIHLLVFNLGESKLYWIQPFTPGLKDLTILSRVLSESKVIPWNEHDIEFAFVPLEFTPVIYKASLANGVELLDESSFDALWFPPSASIEIGDIPPDVTVEFLDYSHGAVMNSTWPYKRPGTDVYLGLQIKNNFGLGIFRKSDKKLVCSALSCHFGGIFVLHTDPESRNKGYAQLLVRHMVSIIRERRQVPFCTIDSKNITSRRLAEKIGFKQFGRVAYIHK